MKDINFLPHEIKDIKFNKKKNYINYSIVFMLIINICVVLHIFKGINEINYKKKIKPNNEIEVFNNNNYKKKDYVLEFFKENIIDNFSIEEVKLNGSTLSLQIVIKDENEFSKLVKELETIKKCSIQYLVAPYLEENQKKFEVGLEVEK